MDESARPTILLAGAGASPGAPASSEAAAEAFARERASRERLEVALDAGRMGTWDWDASTNRVAWSPQLEAIHGLEPGTFGGTFEAYLSDVHPDDAERVLSAIQRSLDSGEHHLEYRIVWPDGTIRHVEARGRAVWDEAGAVRGMRGVCMDVTARKAAEEALRDSEERFRALADNIAQLAWMADPSGSIVWYNRRWYEYTGSTLAEMRGWGWMTVHHPEHLERVVERFKRCIDSGESWEDTFPLRGADGRYRWFLSRAQPIRDVRDQIVRWFGTNTDITQQRWTEALLAGERHVLEMIARGLPFSAVLDVLMRTVEEIAGDGLLASILLLDQSGSCLRHGAAPSLPDEYNRAIDGSTIGENTGSCGTAAHRNASVVVTDIATDPLWVDFRHLALPHDLRACWSTPVRGTDGRVLGTFAMYYREARAPSPEHLRIAELVGRTAAILIERKRADDVSARLAAIVDGSDDAIVGKALDGTVTNWNPGAARLYGYSAEEMVGRPVTQIIPATRLAEYEGVMERVCRGERVPAFDTIRRHRDGRLVDVSLSISPIVDDSGTVIGISAIARDIHLRRRLELERTRLFEAERTARADAEAAIKARDEFVAVVSHDLRNPLAAVRGQLQYMRRRVGRGQVPTAQDLQARLETIEASVMGLAVQIDELQDATRLQAGRPLELDFDSTDLVMLAREATRRMQQSTEAHRVRFATAIPSLLGTWDTRRLERVLANLLSNAVKFSPDGGEIVVELGTDGDQAVLTVSDQGVGIPAADLPHIFERYRRASNVVNRIPGSGLGLAGAQDIVAQHGGTMGVESVEGRGATFFVYLPLAGAGPAAEPPSRHDAATA